MTIRILISLIFSLTFICCTDKSSNIRLSRVENLSSESPKEAWDSLSAINYDYLSDADKHYYDFLSVKVADKAYLIHSSDSLILKVIDFESKHQKYGRYPEALYYGGRVYSDIGDYPTALKYFQQALDRAETTNDLKLKNRILSQTGRLLNSLRLYEKAISYITKAVQIDSILNDSLNYMYDTQLLGAINLHAKQYNVAESNFRLARKLALKISPEDVLQQDMYLSAIKYYTGDLDSALLLIRPIINNINTIDRNNALAYASSIYLRCGIVDTAYMYAKELINTDSYNKELGYRILLSPQLKDIISPDSLYPYITRSFSIIEDKFNQHSTQEAFLQNSFYNYQIHEQKHIKAIKKNNIFKQVIVFMIIMVLGLIVFILFLKNRNKTNLLKLHEALSNLKTLRASLNPDTTPNISIETKPLSSPIIQESNIHQLKKQLQEELLALQQSCTISKDISPIILRSQAYAKLQSYVSTQKIIVENNPLWKELDLIVTKCSPNFKYHLQLLTGGKLKDSDYHIALLIKCGITPTQMTFLIGKTKGTISYRRENLCFRIFEKKLGSKTFDNIIFSL
ncbi:MAG: hypothetical protein K2O38_00840 [Muribaculaceae bacterium]|nr:hypothetical protein [Muribaculaceae bacterium]